MFYLVCYDIANVKRLVKIAKICLQYGVRLQKSCFQCDLEAVSLKKLVSALERTMESKEDSIILYAICSDCLRMTKTEGPGKIIDPDRFVIL